MALKLLFCWIRDLVRIRKNWKQLLKSVSAIAIVCLSILSYYMLCAGFSYNRAPVVLPMSEVLYRSTARADYDAAVTLENIADYFYEDYVALSEKYAGKDAPYSLNDMAERVRKEMDRLNEYPYYYAYTPPVKKVQNSWFLTSAGIGGIAFLPLGEPNINTHPHPASIMPLAHTMAHELAHTKGVMRENDANLVGYYILLTADDEYLRLCGYYASFSQMRSALTQDNDQHYDVLARYPTPEGIQKEARKIYDFWETYESPLAWLDTFMTDLSTWFNNLYLKSNGIETGTGSYHDFPSGSIDTGEIDPDTQAPILIPCYNNIQKLYFSIYEKNS